MADYNTHKDSGSGDRVCYHGVTDMFRNHKLAAAVYSSQGEGDVLEISSSMDIGEHPACVKGDVWAFTNADSIKMYKNGEFIKEYFPSKTKNFRNLNRSPILIDDFIGDTISKKEKLKPRQAKLLTDVLNYIARHGYGNLPANILLKAAECMLIYRMSYNDIVDMYTKHAGDWGGVSTVYRFDAIKNGNVVKSVTKAPMTKGSLKVNAYKTILTEREGYDVTALRINAVDEYGNTLYFSTEPIKASVSGPVEIIGPELISLKGGMGGLYLKTTGQSGEATVTLTSASLGEVTLSLEVRVEG
jgi:beta-galactosidase